MQDAIEIPLSDNERAVLAEVAAEAQAAKRKLEDQLLQVNGSMQFALETIARLHGHKGGRLEVRDGKFYVFPEQRTEI